MPTAEGSVVTNTCDDLEDNTDEEYDTVQMEQTFPIRSSANESPVRKANVINCANKAVSLISEYFSKTLSEFSKD